MTFDVDAIMRQCIGIARKNKTPFGAALVNSEGHVLKLASNTTRKDGPVAHAEVNVLRHAHEFPQEKLFLVTTCEPCPMCAGAALWAKVQGICFGASIEDAGSYMRQIDISCQRIVAASWTDIPIKGAILHEECLALFE